jgi:hypothetical protein
MGYSQAQKVQGHEKILDIAGLQPGSAKSDVRCSPCAPKVIHDLDAVIVVLYRGLGSPFNFNALKVRPHKKLSPPRHPLVHYRKHVTPLEKIRIASCSLSKSVFSFLLFTNVRAGSEALGKKAAVEVIETLRSAATPSFTVAEERAMFDFCEQLHRAYTVEEETFRQLIATLGNKAAVEVTALCGSTRWSR